MKNPIIKDDLKAHWRIENWYGKKIWFVNFLDEKNNWRRNGICNTEEDCHIKIKDCINNFKK